MKTHGEVRLVNGKRVATPEYRSWQMMKNRCLNPKARDYKYYGAKGVTIEPSWLIYENFLADMGRKPHRLLTLERLKNTLGYTKDNCVWATRKTQSRNRKYCKITPKRAARIRSMYSTGRYRQVDLAAKYNVCQRTISLIVRDESWR